MLPIGTHITLKHDVDRYPHFIATAGMTGTVTESTDEILCIRMDDVVQGAEDWDNEIIWSLRDGDDPLEDVTPA